MKITSVPENTFTCNHCNTKAEYEDSDINYKSELPGYDEYENRDVYYVTCPTCGKNKNINCTPYQKEKAQKKVLNPIEPVERISLSITNNIPSQKDSIACLLALLESLSFEVMSGDVWYLAMSGAKDIAMKKYGISQDTFIDIMERFEKVRSEKSKTNPMSGMF